MTNCNGKAVKLNSDTLNFLEEYRDYLISCSFPSNMRRYIQELSYDKLIRSAILDILDVINIPTSKRD